jgi:hypothetical protein
LHTFAGTSITTLSVIVQKCASYLIFSSLKLRQRQEATKLFIRAMHNNTM